ncbi:activating signal cointegrator 1 complex subunit 2 [Neltuma alba]|uniref:activating signal cointegrator 1 complex subunit 2 n=1 Tax=Neltuma alba TaxID=207710 RepID=UPI0010A32B0B|nr:activating signal cointegrator 1 complex subunit 2 [Prosopis alba]
MSNRYGPGRQEGNKGFVKAQKKFVPRNSNTSPSGSKPTLSTSLRQSNSSKQSDGRVESSSSVSASMGRVQMGDNGQWVSNRAQVGNFVNYLPQDEAVAAGLGAEEGGLDPVESQRVVDLLNRELSRLLKLKPKEFWKEVATDTSLHEFLDSFLKFRSRWYDFPYRGAKGIVAGIIVGELDLSRRVFMVLYRISSNKDPGDQVAHSLNVRDHGVLLQEKKLLDLPKLLDICAIYSHENEELTRLLVRNALNAQPWICDNLTAVITHFLGIAHTMHERCSSSLEVLFSSGKLDDRSAAQLQADLLEVVDFINDAVVSMDAFVSAYKLAAVFFSCPVEISSGNEELLSFLARLHDSLLPSLLRGFHTVIADEQDGRMSNIVLSLKMLRMRLVNFGWQLLRFCYLSDEVFRDSCPLPASTKMFPATVEDPVIRADILVQTFREINAVSLQLQENQQKETFIQHIQKSYNILKMVESLRDNGWIFVDDEQFQYISGIMNSKEIYKDPQSARGPVESKPLQADEDAAIIESKISQIRDLFPDYGKGFLGACLEVYDRNPEEVIQRILEGTLHEDLQCLDRSLDVVQPAQTATVNRNDKGKGKLIDSMSMPSNTAAAFCGKQETDGPLFSSSESLGKYVKKSEDDLSDANILDTSDEKHKLRTAALVSQYEYEDEYDDSFDDLGFSVADTSVEENEVLENTAKSGKSWPTETGEAAQNAPSSKWGSRKKPQYYVKDGKNYSYKVAGAIAVANSHEASLVNQSQEELIYGLGRGGNHPLGAVKKLTDFYNNGNDQSPGPETEERENLGNSGGRGRKEGGRSRASHVQQDKQSDASESEGKGDISNHRGRGRRGGGGGGGRNNNYRKDRAMKKHFSGLRGY